MHPIRFLERWFERNTPFIHRIRAVSLANAVQGLLCGGTLTLTHIGRGLPGPARTKNKIKRVDRLLGNTHLHAERVAIYRELTHWLLAGIERPVIIVDWSDCEPGHRWLMLTAALALGGRALTIYEEVHPLRRYNSPRTHRRFLSHLKVILPEHCRPILVTDAGFRGPWFRDVEAYGWDWVGRVRNRIKICLADTGTWRYTTAIYRSATHRIRHLGECWLSHKHPYRCRLYLVKVSRRGPGRPVKAHGVGTITRRCRKLYNDPWLLATSLPHRPGAARRIMKLYAKRMQIEETFRDLKGHRWGFGLELARCQSVERRQALLLIATFATLVLWLAGLAARARRWEAHFQANTVRYRRVHSAVFLGREVLKHPHLDFKPIELQWATQWLRDLLRTQAIHA